MKSCDVNCNCTIFHQDTLDKVQETLYSDTEFDELVTFFKLLQDKSRLKIIEAIKDHELCVCDLAFLCGVSKSAISHQMKLLKSYDIVSSTKKGKMVYYRLKDQEVRAFINHSYNQTRGLNT
jgi:DNA-binding transcriptional ArsR family regulator